MNLPLGFRFSFFVGLTGSPLHFFPHLVLGHAKLLLLAREHLCHAPRRRTKPISSHT